MRAFQECRQEDIGRFDRISVACQCGRTVLLHPSAPDGLPNNLPVLDLKPRLRCDGCGEKGKAEVSVIWATYAARRG
jgi:hypothetical protein